MALRPLYPTQANITVSASAKLTVAGRGAVPEAGLRPFRLRVFDSPEFRMRGGFPMDVPSADVRGVGLVSAIGHTVAFRPGPRDIETNAAARWIPDEDFFDDVTGTWLPMRSDIGAISWLSATTWMPTLVSDYTYGIAKERFTVKAMNFDHDSSEHMWTQALSLTGSAGFTVLMVCSMNSVYGNSGDADFSGIFAAGMPTDYEGVLEGRALDDFELRLSNNQLRMVTVQRNELALGIADLMGRSAPMYLAVAFGRPSSKVYAGAGPGGMTSAEVRTGSEGDPYYGDFVLARSTADTLHTADMAVMDLSLYPDKLTPQQIRTEVALLSSVYGGDS